MVWCKVLLLVVSRLLPGTEMSPHSLPVTPHPSLKQGLSWEESMRVHLEASPKDTRGCCEHQVALSQANPIASKEATREGRTAFGGGVKKQQLGTVCVLEIFGW